MSLGGGQNTEGSNAGGIFVQFNQDCTSLVAGSSSGYHLFALTPDDGIEEIYASRTGQETCLVDRLFSSSLVAVVTVSAPSIKDDVCYTGLRHGQTILYDVGNSWYTRPDPSNCSCTSLPAPGATLMDNSIKILQTNKTYLND